MRPPRRLGPLAWGVFCASSWAWCIGLFLPVVLRRLMGWPGFVAFAVPNVVGCTLFGFLVDRRRSRALRRDHGPAMRLFSAVTLAYQLLLAGWTGSAASGLDPWSGAALGIACVGSLLATLPALPERWWPVAAAGAWLLSCAAMGGHLLAAGPAAMKPPELPPDAVWGLLPVLVLGFLLCPYLDLSFHRALRRAKAAPTFLAFGALFAMLIVLTALLADPEGPLGLAFTPAILAALWTQLGFTAAVHAREIRLATPLRPGMGAPRTRGGIAAILVAAAAGAALGLPGIASEQTYLHMLGMYGLLFPAYVLLAIAAAGGPPTRRTLATLAIVVAASLPFFEWGLATREFHRMALPLPLLLAAAAWLRLRRTA